MAWLYLPLVWSDDDRRWEAVEGCCSSSAVQARADALMRHPELRKLPRDRLSVVVLDLCAPAVRRGFSILRLSDAEAGEAERTRARRLYLYCLRCEAELLSAGIELPDGRPE